MSINVRELICQKLRDWVSNEVEGPDGFIVPENFWVNPVHPNDPQHGPLVRDGLKLLKSTKILNFLDHDSNHYIITIDDSGLKISLTHSSGLLPNLKLPSSNTDFSHSKLHFLQIAYLATKFKISAQRKIPFNLVSAPPIFEDDLKSYLPDFHTLKISSTTQQDPPKVIFLKALLILEADKLFISQFQEEIISVALSIPTEGHEWIFEQLMTAIHSGRISSFYLELYKIFEFFFPLESVFKLADRLNISLTELELLEHCRSALSWNINHQKGARSAVNHATTYFAEVCLNESYVDDINPIQFKEKAMEKLTGARHSLTHQDFKSAIIPDTELKRMTKGLLIFLQEAFQDYSARRKSRTDRKLTTTTQTEN